MQFFYHNFTGIRIPDVKFSPLKFEDSLDLDNKNDENRLDEKRLAKANVGPLISLVYELLRFASLPNVKMTQVLGWAHESVSRLTVGETLVFEVKRERVYEMFNRISMQDHKTVSKGCKIVAMFNIDNSEALKETLVFIEDELKEDRMNTRYPIYLGLMKKVMKVKDTLENVRISSIVSTLIEPLVKSANSNLALDYFLNFIENQAKSNKKFNELLRGEDKLHKMIIETIDKAMEGTSYKNSKMLNPKKINDKLKAHKETFKNFAKLTFEKDEDDSATEPDKTIKTNKFKKGQEVEFFDKKFGHNVKGVVVNSYENIVKVKRSEGLNSQYYFFEDDSEDLKKSKNNRMNDF